MMALTRIGAISEDSDLTSPASPGRSRFEVVRPGIGSRADDDRITRIAGSSLSRRCGSAARISRSALRSVPSIAVSQACSSSSSNPPSGGPPLLTSSRSRPPNRSTAVETGGCRTVRGGEVRGDGRGRIPEAANLGGEPVGRTRHERNPGALVGKGARDRRTEPARGAAEERTRSRETEIHPLLPAGIVAEAMVSEAVPEPPVESARDPLLRHRRGERNAR